MEHIEILGNGFVSWKYWEIWGILKYRAMALYSGNIGKYGAHGNIGQWIGIVEILGNMGHIEILGNDAIWNYGWEW